MAHSTPKPARPDWPADVFTALKALGVSQVATVPDAGHARLLELCAADPAMTMVPLTTEEEGIALLAGAWLGGERGVLLMQSSGVGNCVNMLSLARTCCFPLLMLVTMRGQSGETNPWQEPMGGITADVLELQEVAVLEGDDPARLGALVRQAGAAAFGNESAAAVLVAQSVIGVKTFEK